MNIRHIILFLFLLATFSGQSASRHRKNTVTVEHGSLLPLCYKDILANISFDFSNTVSDKGLPLKDYRNKKKWKDDDFAAAVSDAYYKFIEKWNEDSSGAKVTAANEGISFKIIIRVEVLRISTVYRNYMNGHIDIFDNDGNIVCKLSIKEHFGTCYGAEGGKNIRWMFNDLAEETCILLNQGAKANNENANIIF